MRMVAVLVVAMALVIGVVPQFTHCKTGSTMSATGSSAPASGVSTTAAGAATTAKPAPMRCYWSARAELGVALPLAAAGVLLFLSRCKETRRALAILVGVRRPRTLAAGHPAQALMDLLAEEELPVVISERCQGLIRALSQVKPHNSQHEIYYTDHETHSHPLDALRYLLVNMPRPSNWTGPVYEGPDMYSRWERGMLW